MKARQSDETTPLMIEMIDDGVGGETGTGTGAGVGSWLSGVQGGGENRGSDRTSRTADDGWNKKKRDKYNYCDVQFSSSSKRSPTHSSSTIEWAWAASPCPSPSIAWVSLSSLLVLFLMVSISSWLTTQHQSQGLDPSSSTPTMIMSLLTFHFDRIMHLWDEWKDRDIHRNSNRDHDINTETEENHFKKSLHQFADHVRNLWNESAAATQSKEEVLQHNFDDWYTHASAHEKHWWNNTLSTLSRMADHSEHTTQLWWNVTQQHTAHGWHASVQAEGEWWNATRHWFENQTQAQKERMQRFHNRNRTHHLLIRDAEPPIPLLYFNTSMAFQMLTTPYGWLDRSDHFFLYQQGWDAQINQAYCGVATVAAVLNSFKGSSGSTSSNALSRSNYNDASSASDPSLSSFVHLPVDPVYDPYPYATQYSILRNNTCVYESVTRVSDTLDEIRSFPGGLNLEQVAQLLQCYLPSPYWNVTRVHVEADNNDISLDTVRRDMIQALRNPNARVLVNFHRGVLGQAGGGGHFSPIAAYSSQETARLRVLLLDVAKYKYPPVWVALETLYAAMQSPDVCGQYDFPVREAHYEMLQNVSRAYVQHVAVSVPASDAISSINNHHNTRTAVAQAEEAAAAQTNRLNQILQEATNALGCKEQARGYIIVEKV